MKLYSNPLIERLKKISGESIIIEDHSQLLSASDLLHKSIQRAKQLNSFGIDRKQKVIILLGVGIEFAINIYALMMLDAIIVIIDPEMGYDNFNSKLKHLKAEHVILDSRIIFLQEHPILRWIVGLWVPMIKNIPYFHKLNRITVGVNYPTIQKKHNIVKDKEYHEDHYWDNADLDSEFIITYTSGTTSEPKGVVHTYNSIQESIIQLSSLLKKQSSNSILATHLPHYLLLGINSNLKVCIWNNNLEPHDKIEFIRKKNITTLFGPPSEFVELINYLEKKEIFLPACIKTIYLGSAPVYKDFINKFIKVAPETSLICIYGMTENLVISYIDAREKVEAQSEGDLVGTAVNGLQVSLSDENELIIESNQLFKNYYGQSDSFKSHATGDLAKLNNHGQILLMGRKKDMIIRKNFNIYPSLYESTINSIPGVNNSAMIGIYNNLLADEKVILVVETNLQLTESKMLGFLKSGRYSIDKEAIPDKIVFDKIPLCGRHAKLNKKLLKEKILQIEF